MGVEVLHEEILNSSSPIEYEIRFGRQLQNRFSSCCTASFFDSTLFSLNSFDKWDSVKTYKTQDAFHEGVRYRRTSDGNVESCKKRKLMTKRKALINCDEVKSFYPSDIRISIAAEEPVESPLAIIHPEYVRVKETHEFVKGNFAYMVSTVRSGSALDKLSDPPMYEIEIELLDPLRYIQENGHKYVEKSILLKISNVLQGRGFVHDNS